MAQTVHLELEIDGSAIHGESNIASLDRADTIECSSFRYDLTTPRESSGQLTGRRQHGPVKVQKRIDTSTVALIKAVCMNEPVTKAVFRFYRPSTDGAGTEQQFYTVELADARVASVSQVNEDAIVGGDRAPPMMEEITFTFRQITWTYEPTAYIHTDNWGGDE